MPWCQIFSRAGWNRAKYPNFADCLASRVNGIVLNRWRRKGTHAEVASELGGIATADSCRSPEEMFADREMAGAACSRVLDRLDGNEAAVAVFMAMAEAVDKPMDIAAEAGLPIGAVYRARERIVVVQCEVAEQLRKEMGA